MKTYPEGEPAPGSFGRDRHLLERYGIANAQYEALLASQNGVCKLCEKVCPTGKRLAVDRNLATGEVRGLLCMPCNRIIGLIDKRRNSLPAIFDYLETGALTANAVISVIPVVYPPRKRKWSESQREAFMASYETRRDSHGLSVSASLIGEHAATVLHDKDWIYDQFLIKQRSLAKVAEELGVSYNTVRRATIRFGLKRRSGGWIEVTEP
jgi:ferredoxin